MAHQRTEDIPVFREDEPAVLLERDIRAIRHLMIAMVCMSALVVLFLGIIIVTGSLILGDISGIQCAVQGSC